MEKEKANEQFEQLLAQNIVFKCLDDQQRSLVANQAIQSSFSKGEFITHLGDAWPFLFMVQQGEIIATIDSDEGRSFVVATFEPGDIFWGLAFFQDAAPMPVALEATVESHIHLWGREALLPVLLENGHMSWELNRLLVHQMLTARKIVAELAFQPVTSRLARLLLDQFKPTAGDQVTREFTLDEMASRIGTTREMVCRILYKFSDEGAIQINRTEFTFIEPDALLRHANMHKNIGSQNSAGC
ncbi:MAG: Crp/Fnr family transcriptional regulator [Chloroflexi bacterium]|nr:MAG: Crp/Fnr family transcriptional regulator [Chloroflexota bacterium]MBL1195006.1 Crp/Fnr family transcriptional regulator [Chloroflexota bacterium]NOH12295.1 Crp/Fnr family transcriptional regulator [Chloroflexota bacterium]